MFPQKFPQSKYRFEVENANNSVEVDGRDAAIQVTCEAGTTFAHWRVTSVALAIQ